MHHLELSPEEYAVLHGVIAARLAEIRREVHHTDHREFKAFLLQREQVLARLLTRMEEPAVAEP
jgi:hypothetical protein